MARNNQGDIDIVDADVEYYDAPAKAKQKTDGVKVDVDELIALYDADVQSDEENRTEALQDLKFRSGEQWPSNVIQERQGENRPTVTINKTGQFIRQVTGDLRKNPPSIRIRPVGEGADPDTAKVLGGLIRKIEMNSDAQNAYITAVDQAATCGMGHWRVLTQYSQWDVFDQDIVVEPIMDPMAVVWDRMSEKPDRTDAKHCFISQWMRPEEFKEAHPDAAPVSFDDRNLENSAPKQWFGEDLIRVAEVFFKRPMKRVMALMPDGKVVDITDMDESVLFSLPIVRKRETMVDCVYWAKINGQEVLEGPRKWPGRYIPVVPVIGEEIHNGERLVRKGIIRDLKDAQRLYNYARSAEAEVVALQPKAPFIGTKKQLQGHWDMWKNANKKNYPALVYDADPQAPGPPQRVQPPVASQALAQMAATSSDDMKSTTGIYDASLGARTNETSGVAIRARQAEGDTGTFVFSDNLARSMKQSARVILDLIPSVYDTERMIVVMHEDDSIEETVLNQVVMVDGEPITLHDVTMGKYDVEVTVGPTYATRRAEAVESMTAFAQTNPQAAALISDLIAKNSDWPGAEQIARRLRKIIPPQILEGEKNDEDEAQQLQGPVQPVDPAQAPSGGGVSGPSPGQSGPAAPADPNAGPNPAEMAEKDAKLGLEAQKIDNDHDYKMGQLAVAQKEVAIKAFLAKLQALQQQHEKGIALREQDLAEIESLAGQVQQTDPMYAEGAGGDAGVTEGMPTQPDQPPRIADLISQVAQLTQQVAAAAAAPKQVIVQRDPVTGLMTSLIQIPVQQQPEEPMMQEQPDGYI
jgi:hypothetical protein